MATVKRFPVWFYIVCPLLGLGALLLSGYYETGVLQAAPKSFVVDDAGNLYLSRKNGVYVYRGKNQIAMLERTGNDAILAISADGVLTLIGSHAIVTIDLEQSNLKADAFCIVNERTAESSAAYFRAKAERKLRTIGDREYRYRTRLLRYEIVQIAPEGVRVVYRMPVRDYIGALAWLLWAVVLAATVGTMLIYGYKARRLAKRTARAVACDD